LDEDFDSASASTLNSTELNSAEVEDFEALGDVEVEEEDVEIQIEDGK
jgi:hypothetical protein